MKEAVSVSLGSRTRDAQAKITLLGHSVHLWREGWDGDVSKVIARFAELDGRAAALGVGGIDLWLYASGRRYKLQSAQKLVAKVNKTPVVDGSGLKNTLEKQTADFLQQHFANKMGNGRVLVTSALDRGGMVHSFFQNRHEVLCGDLAFALGLPIPVRTMQGINRLARLFVPILTRLPIRVLYPTGDKQNEIHPKYENWYQWADIIAGDCLYIKQHLPDKLEGKIIVTNTTTAADRELFASRGVQAIVTTTPIMDGRSFGTNLLEAGLTAVADKKRTLTESELTDMISQLALQPNITYQKK